MTKTAPSSAGYATSSPREERLAVLQGCYEVTDAPDTVLSAVLGSCVSACLWDEGAGLGGMNHFLLVQPQGADRGQELRYGVHAMELLINALVRAGARRSALQAKLFGGASMTEAFADVGRLNAEFATDFLKREGIVFRGGSLGGTAARRVEFWAATGRARQRAIQSAEDIFMVERRRKALLPAGAGEVQLFGD